ncbi:glycosyltransferase family 4 protein [Thioalkalivibrio sp. ALJ7]|uniref:glycosyltransferase family 4 protein n=1 Tax=Thioalkalivibrio sp. ALJ7 TaxID=1158756 RepID=UPI0021008E8E|nr:glycosyltransferase family 4 protein [Thioalkalivibrio sp. ALJ7]
MHMCDALIGRGLRVSVAPPASSFGRASRSALSGYGVKHEVPIHRLWKPGIRGGGLVYRFFLKRLLSTSPADFVYGRSLQGCRIAAELGKPTAFEAHKPEWELGERSRVDFERLLAGTGFRAVVCISEALERRLLEAFPGLDGRTIVAHDGAPALEKPESAGRNEEFVVGYFGSLHKGKGVETLLEVAPRCSWATFRIVGGDPSTIQAWREEHVIPANVHFLGHHAHRELPTMMAECDVLVAPYLEKVSVHGGGGDVARWMSPLKLFEYMAMLRPIVAADLPVLREVLRDGDNALLAGPGKVDEWVRALELLRDDGELARRLGEQARSDYEARHTWDARAGHILSELRRIGAVSA